MTARIAVNGRFLTMTATGVQRYAREILPHLAELLGPDLVVVVPPDVVMPATDAPGLASLLAAQPTGAWHGMHGHWWEQARLPALARKTGARVLWSPCDWGPLRWPVQVPVIHDIGPLTDPQWFDPAYRMLARALTRPLVRRAAIVVTPSAYVASELTRVLGTPAARIHIVPPGVGEPFASWRLDDIDTRPRRWCAFVGAHDARKNVSFLLDLWPSVFEKTGLTLRVTRRSMVTTRDSGAVDLSDRPGVEVVVDPTDDALVSLYAGALCLVWPSRFEGYGFPLLEAMAVGTPFLSTDTGAAAELAIDPAQQIVPLDPTVWIERLVDWAGGGGADLRMEGARRARELTWRRTAAATADLLRSLAAASI